MVISLMLNGNLIDLNGHLRKSMENEWSKYGLFKSNLNAHLGEG